MAIIEDVEEIIAEISPYYKKRKDLVKKKVIDTIASEEHKLVYDSTSETLEPIYFWTLDKMNDFFPSVEKLIDNFVSSPGSGHFSELMGKATRMQEEAMKILQTIGGVLIKSIVNIIYDLKEFEIRLSHYDASHSKNKEEAESGMLALKQIWMDNVDVKRGRGSINMLAQDLNFVTLRDAFMAANSLEEIDKMDLNDRVKRILKPRFQEFLKWKELSEKELRKRYEIEKTYLKSQINALQLQTRWLKPYLKAALALEQKEVGREPDIVTAFNTIRLELALFGKREFKPVQVAINRKLHESFIKKLEKTKRKYYVCVLIDFYFRGIPQKIQQHFVFGGRTEITFRGYVLNDEELKLMDQKLKESDINDALKLIAGITDESLSQLKDDINYFLAEKKTSEKKAEEDNVNPFFALFGVGEKKEKTNEEKAVITVKKDDYIESIVRKLAEEEAKDSCFNLFDIYKKAHGMASRPPMA